MATYSVVKLLATCICITIVTSWNLPDEPDQLRSLSSQIENLKSLLNQPNTPSYNYNYGSQLPIDNNRNSDYEAYLRQQYILPILKSLSDISEQIIRRVNEREQQQSNVPFPVNIPPRPNYGDIRDKYTPFNGPLGASSYGGFQSQSSGGSSYSSSYPLSVPSSNLGGFGSFTPIKSDSHGFFSGDSSGTLGIPSRFPAVSNRQPEDYDNNQNWGLVTDDNYNARVTPKPPQECNCEEQNKNITSLVAKLKVKTAEKNPVSCKAVILLCCVPGTNEERRRECFTEQQCPQSYSTGIACLPVVIRAVFKDIYGDA